MKHLQNFKQSHPLLRVFTLMLVMMLLPIIVSTKTVSADVPPEFGATTTAVDWVNDSQSEELDFGNGYTGVGICIEYHDDTPDNGDIYTNSDTNRLHDAATSEQIQRAVAALCDPQYASVNQNHLRQSVTYVVWNISDNRNFNNRSDAPYVSAIEANIAAGSYEPAEVV